MACSHECHGMRISVLQHFWRCRGGTCFGNFASETKKWRVVTWGKKYRNCVLRSRRQGLSPMLIFSQMVLRDMRCSGLSVTSWQVRECAYVSSPTKMKTVPFTFFFISLLLSPDPVQGCEGWVMALRGCYFTVTFPWPLLKGLQVRRGPAEGSRALVLGSSAETFLFPGVLWDWGSNLL